jgi:hypothetical protein
MSTISLSPSPSPAPRVGSSQQLASAPYTFKLNALASWSCHTLQLALRYCLDSLLHHIQIACACTQLKWSWRQSTVQQKRISMRRFSWFSSMSYALSPERAGGSRFDIRKSPNFPLGFWSLPNFQTNPFSCVCVCGCVLMVSKTVPIAMDFALDKAAIFWYQSDCTGDPPGEFEAREISSPYSVGRVCWVIPMEFH